MTGSDLFVRMCKVYDIDVVKEYRFDSARKWRFDYAIVDKKVALEVEGGVWTWGRHVRGSGFLRDMEKYNTAVLRGWRVLRCTPETLMTKGLRMLADICEE